MPVMTERLKRSSCLSYDLLKIVAEYMNCRLDYVNPTKYVFIPNYIEFFTISGDAMYDCRPS